MKITYITKIKYFLEQYNETSHKANHACIIFELFINMIHKSFLSCILIMVENIAHKYSCYDQLIPITGLCFLIDRVLVSYANFILASKIMFLMMLALGVDLPNSRYP